MQYPDVAGEAQAIAVFVDDQINKHGRHPGEILVLAQRRTIGNPIHAALKDRGIPSKSYYQESELDSEVAQERLAIFKLFVNRSDRIALRWLLGTGSGDFRAKSYARLCPHCEETGQPPWDALVALSEGKISIPYSNPSCSASVLSRTSFTFSTSKLVSQNSSNVGFVQNSPTQVSCEFLSRA